MDQTVTLDTEQRHSDLRKRIGAILRRLREAEGLTREAFAERVNVSPRVIGDRETGVGRITIEMLFDILWEMDASEDVFLEILREDAHLRLEPARVDATAA